MAFGSGMASAGMGSMSGGGSGGYIGTAVIRVIIDGAGVKAGLTGMQADMATLGGRMGIVGGQAGRLGSVLTRGLTIPLVAATAASVKYAADFEQTMAKVGALSGIASKDLQTWSDNVQRISVETAQGPLDVAETLYFVASAGLKAGQVMPVLEMSAKAATAGFGDMATIGQTLTSVMNAYATSNIGASQTMDVLTAAVKEGKAEPADFANSIGTVLPVAAQAGVSFDQLAGSLAAVTNVGVDTARGVTGLRYLLTNLMNPTDEAKETMDKYGLSTQQVQKTLAGPEGLLGALQMLDKAFDQNTVKGKAAWITTIGGVRASVVANALVGENAKNVQQIFDATKAASMTPTSEFETAYQKMTQTAAFDFQQMFAEMKNAAIDFGSAMMPAATAAMGAIRDIATAIGNLARENPELVAGFAKWAIVLGPALIILSKMMSFASGIGRMFMSFAGAAAKVGGALTGAAVQTGAGALTAAELEAGAVAAATTLTAGGAAAAAEMIAGATTAAGILATGGAGASSPAAIAAASRLLGSAPVPVGPIGGWGTKALATGVGPALLPGGIGAATGAAGTTAVASKGALMAGAYGATALFAADLALLYSDFRTAQQIMDGTAGVSKTQAAAAVPGVMQGNLEIDKIGGDLGINPVVGLQWLFQTITSPLKGTPFAYRGLEDMQYQADINQQVEVQDQINALKTSINQPLANAFQQAIGNAGPTSSTTAAFNTPFYSNREAGMIPGFGLTEDDQGISGTAFLKLSETQQKQYDVSAEQLQLLKSSNPAAVAKMTFGDLTPYKPPTEASAAKQFAIASSEGTKWSELMLSGQIGDPTQPASLQMQQAQTAASMEGAYKQLTGSMRGIDTALLDTYRKYHMTAEAQAYMEKKLAGVSDEVERQTDSWIKGSKNLKTYGDVVTKATAQSRGFGKSIAEGLNTMKKSDVQLSKVSAMRLKAAIAVGDQRGAQAAMIEGTQLANIRKLVQDANLGAKATARLTGSVKALHAAAEQDFAAGKFMAGLEKLKQAEDEVTAATNRAGRALTKQVKVAGAKGVQKNIEVPVKSNTADMMKDMEKLIKGLEHMPPVVIKTEFDVPKEEITYDSKVMIPTYWGDPGPLPTGPGGSPTAQPQPTPGPPVDTGHTGGEWHVGGMIASYHVGGHSKKSGGLKGDEQMAVLQHGEFVMRKEAVRKYGVPMMNRLNMRQMHEGGPAGHTHGGKGGGSGHTVNNHINIHGFMGDERSAQKAAAIISREISRNMRKTGILNVNVGMG